MGSLQPVLQEVDVVFVGCPMAIPVALKKQGQSLTGQSVANAAMPPLRGKAVIAALLRGRRCWRRFIGDFS
jgi:hypothetical protein